jgi:hypothetical protein
MAPVKKLAGKGQAQNCSNGRGGLVLELASENEAEASIHGGHQ